MVKKNPLVRRKQTDAAILDLFSLIPGYSIEIEDGEFVIHTGIYTDSDGIDADRMEESKILNRHFETSWDYSKSMVELVINTGISADE